VDFDINQSSLGLGLLGLGIVAILIGVIGCCLGKNKNVVFALPFIILTAIFGLITLIVGFIMLGGDGVVMEAKNLACG
jgi:hypothetical protein